MNLRSGDFGCWILDAGYWMLDAGCWMLDFGYWMLDKPVINFLFGNELHYSIYFYKS